MNDKFSNVNIQLPSGMTQTIKNTANTAQSYISNFTFGNNITNNVNRMVNTFQSYSDFHKFLIILAIVFIIAMIYWRMRGSPLTETILITNLRNDATKPLTIPYKDVTETTPNLYTYSFWLYINGEPNDNNYWGNYRFNEWKHVLHRGGKLVDGRVKFQSPGFWLSPSTNTLYAAISTKSDIEYITLGDIDLDKWVNIVFVINQTTIEIYKNCKLEKTYTLYNPIINVGQTDLLITQNGGFAGNIAYLQYFNRALQPGDIQALCAANKPVFDRDMTARLRADLAGYDPGIPIQPTPEPEPDPDDPNNQPDSENTCS